MLKQVSCSRKMSVWARSISSHSRHFLVRKPYAKRRIWTCPAQTLLPIKNSTALGPAAFQIPVQSSLLTVFNNLWCPGFKNALYPQVLIYSGQNSAQGQNEGVWKDSKLLLLPSTHRKQRSEVALEATLREFPVGGILFSKISIRE